jgi:hypothetical protein
MHSKERQELYNLPDKEGSGDGPNTHQSQEWCTVELSAYFRMIL